MTNRDIAKRFGKDTLLGMAEELGLEVDVGRHVYKLVDDLIDDLETNGLPDEEVSDALWDFMVASGFIDEDGNELYRESSGDDEGGDADDKDDVTEWKCFGMLDENDPACRRCKGRERCLEKRISVRPSCFGRMYDAENDDCADCVHWKYCQDA